MSTFFIDIDGTIVPHLENDELDELMHYYMSKPEKLLKDVNFFFDSLNVNDCVIFTTARLERHREMTEYMLKNNNIRYKKLLMDLPSGCRMLINDSPFNHLEKAIGITVERDVGLGCIDLSKYGLGNSEYLI